MAEYGEEPSYMDVFIRYYRDLVRGLPASRMREDFIHRGLLGDVSLLADIDAERTDQAKIRILLESIRKGVSICVNNSFLKFLEAMQDYGTESNNNEVLTLAERILQDLPDGMYQLATRACS